MASYSAIITSAEVIIAGGQIFKITASRYVSVHVSEEEINLMKEKMPFRGIQNTPQCSEWHTSKIKSKICAKRNWKRFKFPWKFCLCRHAWINQWFHNKSWLLWWSVSLSIRIQSTLNHIRFVFYHNIKDNKRNLC